MNESKKEIINILRNYFRKRKKRSKFLNESGVSYFQDDIRIKNMVLAELIISQMTDFERKIVGLKYGENENLKTLSERLFVSEATINRRLKVMFRKLERYYEEIVDKL